MTSPKSHQLLAGLPAEEFIKISNEIKIVSLNKGQTLFETGTTANLVYYPVGALVSMAFDTAEGDSIDIGLQGKADLVGCGALRSASFYRAIVRCSGLAYKMPTRQLLRLLPSCPEHERQWCQMEQALPYRLSEALACSKYHGVEQQLAHWIVAACAQSSSQLLEITQHELAGLLGFRRESICIALNKFSKLGLVCTHRNAIELLDPAQLQSLACKCPM